MEVLQGKRKYSPWRQITLCVTAALSVITLIYAGSKGNMIIPVAVALLPALAYIIMITVGELKNAFLLLFSLGCLLLGGILSFINIPISTTLLRITDKDMLSKVSSILSIFSQGLIPIASVLAGIVLQCFGSTPLLLFCSLGFTFSALFALFNKQIKEI